MKGRFGVPAALACFSSPAPPHQRWLIGVPVGGTKNAHWNYLMRDMAQLSMLAVKIRDNRGWHFILRCTWLLGRGEGTKG